MTIEAAVTAESVARAKELSGRVKAGMRHLSSLASAGKLHVSCPSRCCVNVCARVPVLCVLRGHSLMCCQANEAFEELVHLGHHLVTSVEAFSVDHLPLAFTQEVPSPRDATVYPCAGLESLFSNVRCALPC